MRTFKLFIDRKSSKTYELWGYSLYEYGANGSVLTSHNTKRYHSMEKTTVERAIKCYTWGIEASAPIFDKLEDDVEVTIFITNKSVYKRLENPVSTTYRIEMEHLRNAIDNIYGTVCIECVDCIRNKTVLSEESSPKEKYEKISDFMKDFS